MRTVHTARSLTVQTFIGLIGAQHVLENIKKNICLISVCFNCMLNALTNLQIRSHAQIVVPNVVVLAQQRVGQLDRQSLAIVVRLILAHAIQNCGRIRGNSLVLRVQQFGQRRRGAFAFDQLGALLVGG